MRLGFIQRVGGEDYRVRVRVRIRVRGRGKEG